MIRIPLLAVLLLGAAPGWSAGPDLYTGTAPVRDKSEAERRARVPDALIQVLQKISGLRDVPPHPALDDALATANGMLISFQYREVERLQPDGNATTELLLVANFLPSEVDRVVREMGLRRWLPERKPVVVWVVVTDDGRRKLLPLEYEYAWQRMEDSARHRGLRVARPDLTGELRQEVDTELLWAAEAEQLLEQYRGTAGVAIVAARREGPEWNLRWSHADTDTAGHWRTRATDLSQALVEGIHRLTDQIAGANSIESGGLGQWRTAVLVSGLAGGADYARCLAHLQSLSLVDEVEVTAIGPGGVRFVLQLNAAPEYLDQSIRRGGLLEGAGDDYSYLFLR